MTTPAPQEIPVSALETIYKDDLVGSLIKLDEHLEKGMVLDGLTDPTPLLDQFSQALFDPSRPIGEAIQGDAYLIETLPESIGDDGKQIASLLIAKDFFTTPQALLITQSQKQNQGLVDLIDSTIYHIGEPANKKEFGNVAEIISVVQQHLEDAKQGGYLHLPNKNQVLVKINSNKQS